MAGKSDVAEGGLPPQPEAEKIEPAARPGGKIGVVVDLLQRTGGATLAELVEATDWLPHTTRAALTGLRKKGHAIEKTKRDEATCYVIGVAA
jgi:transcription initiation factor IIE alpha subunit